MFQFKHRRWILSTIPAVAILSGCGMFHGGMQHNCASCQYQHGPGTPVETHPPTIDETLSREFADAKVRGKELAMQLNEMTAERDRLEDQVMRMEREHSSTLSSVTNANHQVDKTRSELDRASRDIQLMRQQLQQVIDEVSSLDARHDAQMGQFSRQLDGLVDEYGDVPGATGSYRLGPSLPQKP